MQVEFPYQMSSSPDAPESVRSLGGMPAKTISVVQTVRATLPQQQGVAAWQAQSVVWASALVQLNSPVAKGGKVTG